MTRILVHAVAANEKAQKIAARWEKRVGTLMNIHAGMTHSPTVVVAYEGITQAVGRLGTFDARTKEVIALAIDNEDECDYGQASHTISPQRAGLSGGKTSRNTEDT